MGCECAKSRYYPQRVRRSCKSTKTCLRVDGSGELGRDRLLKECRLNLNCEGVDSAQRPLHNFYSFFRCSNAWDKRRLCLLGLLLSHGSSGTKLDILFSLSSTSSSLKITELDRLFRDLLHISSICLPSYAQYWLEVQDEPEKAEELIKYKEKLAMAVPDTVSMLGSLLVPATETEVSREHFQQRLRGDVATALFNARQLRMLSLEVYKRSRKERNRRQLLATDDLLESD